VVTACTVGKKRRTRKLVGFEDINVYVTVFANGPTSREVTLYNALDYYANGLTEQSAS